MSGRVGRTLRSRRVRWLAALVGVIALVVTAMLVVLGSAARQQADDPRSSTQDGSGALGALLQADGVELVTTSQVDAAVARTDEQTTLVVAAGDRLSDTEAQRLVATRAARLVLVRPTSTALTRFGVTADAADPADGTVDPGCADPAAQRAGAVTFIDLQVAYRPTGPSAFTCYRAGAGFAYLQSTAGSGRPVELVAGGLTNADLGQAGNAALGLNVLGSQPRVVWLMSTDQPPPAEDADPTLLPGWWALGVVQAALGLVVVGVWRGRRLGPILTEALPVTVRASETVEGHGRLYYRLNARDRAAEALRTGARLRLSRILGHAQDPLALSEVVGSRTGRDAGQVRYLLFGPAPDTDDHLVELTRNLDQLEQEARQL